MSRKITYTDDVIGTIETYIPNEDSDWIIDAIRRSRKAYHGKDDIVIKKGQN